MGIPNRAVVHCWIDERSDTTYIPSPTISMISLMYSIVLCLQYQVVEGIFDLYHVLFDHVSILILSSNSLAFDE